MASDNRVRYRLANVLVKPDVFTAEHPELYLRGESWRYDEGANALVCAGPVEFSTYFNALSVAKWKRYTVTERIFLHLELAGGPCAVRLLRAGEGVEAFAADAEPIARFAGAADGGTGESADGAAVGGNSDDAAFAAFDIELPLGGSEVLVTFALEPVSARPVLLRAARYEAEVAPSDVRPVSLALSTTTFKKEEFILANIDAVRREVLGCDEPIAGGFRMIVVDNGRTLDAEGLSGEGVTVIPNKNAGGAGGFARGMMEALAAGAEVTHVLLMDDDVRVSPESFKRTFALLSLRRAEYEEAFVAGAMLVLDRPNMQYEDVAHVRTDGVYDRIKPDLDMAAPADLVRNEIIPVEVENAYDAWWYCCIPLAVVRRAGLPLPLFMRCDDVEYGMRTEPRIMCMNGICVWHDGFDGRFRGVADCYLLTRNFLIMIAIDQKSSERLYMARLSRTISIYLRSMAYENAELLLDGLEDYLAGPEWLARADGAALLAEKTAKSEKLVPVGELDPAVMEGLDICYEALDDTLSRSMAAKVLELIPHDRHMLPDALLKDEPAAVSCCFGPYPASKTMRRKTLVALDAYAKNGHIRTMDRARWRALRERKRALMAKWRTEGARIRQAWRDAAPHLTSESFWRDYLGLGE